MQKRKIWVLAAVLMMVLPTYLVAQPESLEFPNDKDGNTNNVATGAGGNQKVRVKVGRFCPNVKADVIPLVGPQTGQDVGLETVNALCPEFVAAYDSCSGFVDGGSCSGLGCCSATNSAATQRLQCIKDCQPGAGQQNPLTEVIIQRTGGSERTTFEARGEQSSITVAWTTDAGNTGVIDLEPVFNIGIQRQGFDGVYTASFATDPNDPNTQVSVSVDSTDPNVVDPNASAADQDFQLHQALADGIIALGLGLDVRCTPGFSADRLSTNPDLFGGTFLHIPNMGRSGVAAVGLGGPEGAGVAGETTTLGGEPIPTLSEWGLILLVAVLFLTGVWMLRRRHLGEAT